MSEPAEIVRRDQGDALSQIIGGGDTRAMLEQVEHNVKTVIDVARARGFVRKYGDNQHEFFGEPAWSLLAMTYGVTAVVEWTKPVDNGWEARAEARTRDGVVVGAAEAMCTLSEPNRRNAPAHTLRAMAQTRARRNALRSAFGAALVLSGVEFADPEAPATREQVVALHTLAGKHGWERQDSHERAGVASFNDLTREQAAELLDEWSTLADTPPRGAGRKVGLEPPGAAAPSPGGDAVEEPGVGAVPDAGADPGEPSAPDPTLDEPAPIEQWKRANDAGITSGKAVKRGRELFPDAGIQNALVITKRQLAAILEEHLKR